MSSPFKKLCRMLGMAAVAISAAVFSPNANAWTQDSYAWSKVQTGGGGEIPALIIHPKVKDVMYIGADVGGLDRWDPVNQAWIPTLDSMRRADQYNFGVAGIAVDPSDTTGNVVYAAVGNYDWAPGEVMKSTDRGNTWIRNSTGMFPFCSNGDQGNTQRLAVDPANSSIIYAAARNGLYRTTDGAVTWTKLTNAPVGDQGYYGSGSGQAGDEMVMLDPTSGTTTSPTRTKRVFLGTYSPTASAFDTGATPGAPRNNFSGWAGYRITIGGTPITVWSLGRWCVSGNSHTHTVKITNASTGVDVSGASVTVNMSGSAAGQYKYANLAAPVTLAANGVYYITSQETSGGDQSYDATTQLWPGASDASADGPASFTSSWTFTANSSMTFGPVDFQYSLGSGTATYPLYKSEDGGTTWTAMSGAPVGVTHAAINSAGAVYCTGPAGVYKYSGGASGTWSTITPGSVPNSFLTIAIDPFNNNNIIVIQSTAGYKNPVYRSTDGGATWPYVNTGTGAETITPVPSFLGGMGIFEFTLAFDPFRQGTVWATDDAAAWMTTNILASNVPWTSYVKGHEETVDMPALLSPPSGPTVLYYGVADAGLFANSSLTAWPANFQISSTLGQPNGWPFLNMDGADFEEANPNFAAVVGVNGWAGPGGGAYTTDGGVTFQQFAAWPSNYGGRIAVSASSQTMVWATSSEDPSNRNVPVRSTNNGASWTACTGAPGVNLGYNIFNWNAPLCSDRKNGTKFYIYNDDGTFYRSTNSGASFTRAASGLPADGTVNLCASPTTEGDLWLSFQGGSGLYHSTDSGTTWTKLSNVQTAYLSGIGKGPNSTTPSIYIMGTVDNDATEGVFRSDNLGVSWYKVDIARPYPGDGPNFICGDRRTYGTVYVGSQVGIYYGQKSGSSAPAPPTGLIATAGNTQVALSWTASTGATSYNALRSTVSGSGYASVATGITVTTYTNTGLTNGAIYYFVVTATNANGTSGNSNQASATPTAGTGNTTYNFADITVNGSWVNGVHSGIDFGQNVWVCDFNQAGFAKAGDFPNSGITSGTFTLPVNTVLKSIQVASGSTGGTYTISDGVNPNKAGTFTTSNTAVTVTTNWTVNARTITINLSDGWGAAYANITYGPAGGSPPSAPTGLSATAGNSQVALSWNASTGATAYDVKRSTVSGSGYVIVSSPTTTSYTNTGLTNGTTYYFVVDAKNASGTSANSSQVSAVPVANTTYAYADISTEYNPVEGVHSGITFPTAMWYCYFSPDAYGLTRGVTFGNGTQTSSTFTLPANMVLKTVLVSSLATGGTYTISDGVNPNKNGTFTTASSPITVTTNWTTHASTITVTLSDGWNDMLGSITYGP